MDAGKLGELIDKIGLKPFGYTLIATGLLAGLVPPDEGAAQWLVEHVLHHTPDIYVAVSVLAVGAWFVGIGQAVAWMKANDRNQARILSKAIPGIEGVGRQLGEVVEAMHHLKP